MLILLKAAVDLLKVFITNKFKSDIPNVYTFPFKNDIQTSTNNAKSTRWLFKYKRYILWNYLFFTMKTVSTTAGFLNCFKQFSSIKSHRIYIRKYLVGGLGRYITTPTSSSPSSTSTCTSTSRPASTSTTCSSFITLQCNNKKCIIYNNSLFLWLQHFVSETRPGHIFGVYIKIATVVVVFNGNGCVGIIKGNRNKSGVL